MFRIVTASSLFDGHDASINVFRRLFQAAGNEVIHIGHNRSVKQLVTSAIQEDADAICVSSYQGGHREYFRYLRDLLNEKGGSHIRIFGGGGGTILPSEITELENYGITRIYHAEEGRKIGLKGIVKDALSRMKKKEVGHPPQGKLSDLELAKAITWVEQGNKVDDPPKKHAPVVGITGPGGAGKSSVVDELILRYLYCSPKGRVGVLAFDPTKKKTGGALLGDRIRMNAIYNDRVFLRSMATHESGNELSPVVVEALKLMQQAEFDLIILETTGIGQGNAGIVPLCDVSIYVMTSEYGASSQLEKIDMLDFADLVVVNKFDKMGSLAAFEDVKHIFKNKEHVFATIASDFNDPGLTDLFVTLIKLLPSQGIDLNKTKELKNPHTFTIIPAERTFYLGEIAKTIRQYHEKTENLANAASELYKKDQLEGESAPYIEKFHEQQKKYHEENYSYEVRGEKITRPLFSKSLSDTIIHKIATPHFKEWGEIVTFMREENFPGYFPYTAGVFPLKNEEEPPKRQFAGEGSPERTNKRFHYLCKDDEAKRLSTAFDSVTLYGEDPDERPDIYGKIGNSGVSIATLDDMKALYKGFDLIAPLNSVSLTINGPSPIILAMFLNTAIDFEFQKSGGNYEEIKAHVLQTVRGTVQADILKEEQAQNTCIFSSKFALKMMGDIQEYFIKNKIRNFYSISISGYHIAEAGANPISQLAFTLANGFTIVEYYLARGMKIDDFAPNLSFFFSSGLDPEYAVIGRVARRIWAVALKERYGAGERSCKLKYHIQTSGRSLHAQEIAFNDIRTSLQALLAIQDNCNSLHTNAYDEAITTPTEESVRRAMAIQLIINKEFGETKCENAIQGSYFIEELTALVEEAVLNEFDSLSRRGGVLGSMEKQHQRFRIQTESMKYELLKSSGELPIIGVNTFTSEKGNIDYEHIEVIRATDEEKRGQIARTKAFIQKAGPKNREALDRLQKVCLSGENIFEELMETVKYCSLGQITHLLYQCGGEYRRSM